MIKEQPRTMQLLTMNLAMLDPCCCHDPSVRTRKKNVILTNSTKMNIRTKITKAETLVEALQTATKAVIESIKGEMSLSINRELLIRGWKEIAKRFEDYRLSPLTLRRLQVPKKARLSRRRSLNARNK